MLEAERGQPGDVLGTDAEAFSTKALQRRVHVDRVPQDDEIDDEAERAKLVFLTFAIALPQFAALAVEYDARKLVATFATIELDQDAAAITFVVDEAQHIERLGKAPQLLKRPRELGWTVVAAQKSTYHGVYWLQVSGRVDVKI